MRVSESWLREWVDPDIDTGTLAAQLTMAGLEVDAVEPAAPEFSGVVIGEIVSVEQHPNADKLRVCQVIGADSCTVQVVCGAPNARPGIKIPFATVGAKLPGDLKIKKAKLRDVESFGMLCGAEELGLEEKSDGLWELPVDAPTGIDIREYLKLDDQLIEVDLTPNRGDCLSIRGIAREVGVINSCPVIEPEISSISPAIDDVITVELADGEACSRYAGRVIRNIDVNAVTPLWMVEKLRRGGVRSIDPVVDVTNYVLLELGQPMHAFDLNCLNGGIQVRMAAEGEKLALLDGTEVTLHQDTLVIADAEKAVAMAGIMGGSDTAVSESTRNIFLESAFFDQIAIAGKARSYGKHTDSSHRFERGVDPELQVTAIERATALLLDIVGGEPGPVINVQSERSPSEKPPVSLKRETIDKQLGIALSDNETLSILDRLGLNKNSETDTGWTFSVPSWRFDIEIEADLIEELARIYGYNNLPTESAVAPLDILASPENSIPLYSFRESLMTRGYQEAITYSFVNPDVQNLLMPDQQTVTLTNPIASDLSVMRTTLWAGLLPALQSNLNRQQSRVRLFETGLRFVERDGKLVQEKMIAGVVTGTREPEGWAGKVEPVDFYDIKGDVELLLDAEGFTFEADAIPALHPGQCARIEKQGRVVGYLGKLHPTVKKQLDISQDVYLFELQVAAITASQLPIFNEVSKYPSVSWDLAFLVQDTLPVGQLLDCVRQSAGKNLTELKVFDVYQGKGVENNRKSVALGLTFQNPSRTLGEDEVTQCVNNVVENLQKQFSATLRGEL